MTVDPQAFSQQDVVLNMNVVFRWEYLPGSLLYFVFTRAQGAAPTQTSGSRPRLDFSSLSRGTTENLFSIKGSFNFSR